MYVDRPIREYLDDLAAKKPSPGGGSAAALAACVATSLMIMVARYTIGKPKYETAEANMADIIDKAGKYSEELRMLIDKDAEAYEKMSRALKECGDDAAMKDELYKAAVEPPFLVCELTHHCLKACKELATHGNRNLITDTAVAAIMLEGAFFSAKFNVYINLGRIQDLDYIGKVHNVLHSLEDRMPKMKEEILEICEDIIRKA
jgi:formiminotetrahydrofolate cyclodeaminase